MSTIRACSMASICTWIWMSHALAQLDTTATSESTWWKGLFRSKTIEQVDTLMRSADSENEAILEEADVPLDATAEKELSLTASALAQNHEPSNWRLQADPRLELMDSVWRANLPAMTGFRIQIMTGSLHACRMERSLLREKTEWEVYVVPMSMNYQVLIGDFRDVWSAEEERKNWTKSHPNALVVPGEIALPPLRVSTK